MIPEAFQRKIEKEIQEYRENVYYHYYWNFRTPKLCLQHSITNLHDHGILIQGELSEKWLSCFASQPPYLPSLNIIEPITWEDVYKWIECLEPVQLRLLYNKINPRKI